MMLESNGYSTVFSSSTPTVNCWNFSFKRAMKICFFSTLSLCWRVTVMVSESNGYGVGEERLWRWRVTVMALESNGYGVGE
jgi:hypothetical protein